MLEERYSPKKQFLMESSFILDGIDDYISPNYPVDVSVDNHTISFNAKIKEYDKPLMYFLGQLSFYVSAVGLLEVSYSSDGSSFSLLGICSKQVLLDRETSFVFEIGATINVYINSILCLSVARSAIFPSTLSPEIGYNSDLGLYMNMTIGNIMGFSSSIGQKGAEHIHRYIGHVPNWLNSSILYHFPLQNEHLWERSDIREDWNDVLCHYTTVCDYPSFQVSKLYDLKNDNDITAPTVLERPTITLDSFDFVDFNSNSRMVCDVSAVSSSTPISLVLVFRQKVGIIGGNKKKIDINGDIIWSNNSADADFTGGNYIEAGGIQMPIPKVSSGSFTIVLLEFNGASSAMYVYDPTTPVATGITGLGSFDGQMQVGLDSSEPEIAEFIVYDTILITQERLDLFDRLQVKYGI